MKKTIEEVASSEKEPQKLFFIMPQQLSWWAWLVTASLLAVGLAGIEFGLLGALVLSILQSAVFLVRERSLSAFSVQLRIAYTILLVICFIPNMNWLFWLPTIGTFALNLFGYCLMVRFLSLLSWNRREPLSFNLVARTFLSRPKLVVQRGGIPAGGCGRRVCSIDAQVRQRSAAGTKPPFELQSE